VSIKTIVVLTWRDYAYQDITGVFSCDYELTQDDWYDFAVIQEDIRKSIYEGMVWKACERVGITYNESVNLKTDAPEYIAYHKWESEQPSIFEMFKERHNLQPVHYIEVY